VILSITPIYAAALTLLYLFLSVRVVAYRKAHSVLTGDAGDPELLARMRAHGNCAEYVPLGIALLVVAELAGAPAWLLNAGGLLLLVGRGLHALSSRPRVSIPLRIAGMSMTMASLGLLAAGALVARAFF
jgi:uncharacterized membrane protein YecN with MAPEG domain